MRLPFIFQLLTGRDIAGIVFVVLVLVLVLFVSVRYPEVFAQHARGGSFGPDWTCQYVPNGQPVCIKNMPKAPSR